MAETFPVKEIRKHLENLSEPEYVITHDTVGTVSAFCLMANYKNSVSQLILADQSEDHEEIKERVENLAKYFKAKII